MLNMNSKLFFFFFVIEFLYSALWFDSSIYIYPDLTWAVHIQYLWHTQFIRIPSNKKRLLIYKCISISVAKAGAVTTQNQWWPWVAGRCSSTYALTTVSPSIATWVRHGVPSFWMITINIKLGPIWSRLRAFCCHKVKNSSYAESRYQADNFYFSLQIHKNCITLQWDTLSNYSVIK